jgi:hypothetical protein
MARYSRNDGTTVIKTVCAIVFLLFVFAYLYSFQAELLEMTQYMWSDGQTHYNHFIGSVIITALLSALSAAVAWYVKVPSKISSIIYVPAFIMLGLITSEHLEGSHVVIHTSDILWTLFLLILWWVMIRWMPVFTPFMGKLRSNGLLSQPWWTNLIIMILGMMLTFSMGNTDRALNTRLKTESLCAQGEWERAVEVSMDRNATTTPSLTMLNAMALARTGEMGEKLFRYDIIGPAKMLFPQSDGTTRFLLGDGHNMWQTLGFVIPTTSRLKSLNAVKILEREVLSGDTLVKQSAKDYLLCAYLLNKNLGKFANTLPRFYNMEDSLPRHYREALAIHYKGEEGAGVDATILADYADLMNMIRKERNHIRRQVLLRDTYLGTYWYYYYKKK